MSFHFGFPMKHKDRELSLEELEFVRGGMGYVNFYVYREEILNKYETKPDPSDYLCYKRQENHKWLSKLR